MRYLLTLVFLCLTCVPLHAGVRYTPASAIEPAVLDVLHVPYQDRYCIRYISLYNVPDSKLLEVSRVVSFAMNSLSNNRLIVQPVVVNPRLLRVNLHDYGIDPKVFDRLGQLGSGLAAFPEPYFHYVTHERKEQYERIEVGSHWEAVPGYQGYERPVKDYKTVSRGFKVCFYSNAAPWLPTHYNEELARQTGSYFPVYRADWFIVNSLIEPRYHELLGLGDSHADVEKATFADDRLADKLGAQARGAVLFSEVANHNRILERTPLLSRYGRGYFWESGDYLSSIAAQDVLVDPLNNKPDAQELIWSLPNGLQGYYVNDAVGKRLDKAAADVASDHRNPFRDIQVYTARNCMMCHAKGIIPIDDEVREHAKDQVTLAVDALKKSGHDTDADRISAKYFEVVLNDLVAADSLSYEQAVKQCCGITSGTLSRHLELLSVGYTDGLNTIEDVANDLGYDVVTVRGVIERTPDLSHVYIGMAKANPRFARRDQIEATFGEIAKAMLTVPVVEGK